MTVTGGKQRSEGPLALKRELREVLRQAADVEGMMASEQTRVAVLTREIGDLTSLLQRLEDDKREAERQAMTSGHTLQQLDSEMARVRERLGTYEREMTRLVAECGQCEVGIAAHRTELLAHDERKASLEVAMEAAQSSLDELRQRRDAAAQHASDARAKLATLEERRRGSAVTVQRLEAMVAEVASRLDKLKGQIESAAAEKEQREQENVASPNRKSSGLPNATPRNCAIASYRTSCNPSAYVWRNWKRPSRPRATNLMPRATAAANWRPSRPGCSPTRSTWPRPASRN